MFFKILPFTSILSLTYFPQSLELYLRDGAAPIEQWKACSIPQVLLAANMH